MKSCAIMSYTRCNHCNNCYQKSSKGPPLTFHLCPKHWWSSWASLIQPFIAGQDRIVESHKGLQPRKLELRRCCLSFSSFTDLFGDNWSMKLLHPCRWSIYDQAGTMWCQLRTDESSHENEATGNKHVLYTQKATINWPRKTHWTGCFNMHLFTT